MKQFDKFEATFAPEKEGLKDSSIPWIGWKGIWQASWTIDKGDRFEGEWACVCIPQEDGKIRPPFGWVALSQLSDILL